MDKIEVRRGDLELWRDLLEIVVEVNGSVCANFIQVEIDKYLEADYEQTDAD